MGEYNDEKNQKKFYNDVAVRDRLLAGRVGAGLSGLSTRRRQPAPRPQRRPGLHRRRPRRERPAGRGGGPAARRRRRGGRGPADQPLSGRPGPGALPSPRRRRALPRGVRRHADRGVRAARPEGALRQGPGR